MPTPEEYVKNIEYYKAYAKRLDKGRARENHKRFRAVRSAEEWKRHRRGVQIKHEYGITMAEWEAMFAAQGYECAICGADSPGTKVGWHTDHDHRTGKVRGILCRGCNQGMGFAKDDPSRLDLMAQYLRHHA